MNWSLNGLGYEGVEYSINRSMFQVNVGFNYKFKNSNGTHNFTIASGRDQAEVDALNAQINSLREENAALTSKDEQNKKNLTAKDTVDQQPQARLLRSVTTVLLLRQRQQLTSSRQLSSARVRLL